MLALLSAGCASSVDRVVTQAMRTPWHEAAYQPSTDTTMGPAVARLEARLEALGVAVIYVDLRGLDENGQRVAGRTNGIAILIDSALAETGRLEVLAHEAGHLFHPDTLTEAEKQAFAELVGVEVCARLGWNVEHAAASYLAAHKSGLAGALAFKVDRERAVRILMGEEEP